MVSDKVRPANESIEDSKKRTTLPVFTGSLKTDWLNVVLWLQPGTTSLMALLTAWRPWRKKTKNLKQRSGGMKVSSKGPHVNECLEGCPVYLCLDGENKELVGSVQNVPGRRYSFKGFPGND